MVVKISCGLICIVCVVAQLASKPTEVPRELIQSICSLIISMGMFLFWLSDCTGGTLDAMVAEMGVIKVGLCLLLFLVSVTRIISIVYKK